MERPQALSPKEAKEKILQILNEGFVVLTDHCRDESMPDHNVEMDDIIEALINGDVKSNPELSADHGNWKCTVFGRGVDGIELTLIVVLIESEMTLKIVTLW